MRTRMLALSVALLASASLASAAKARPLPGAPNCPIFPRSSHWNQRVDRLPLRTGSRAIVRSIGRSRRVHAAFGSGLYKGAPMGFPVTIVGGRQKRVPVSFLYYAGSDPGPYPLPADAPIEGGRRSRGDRHVIVVDRWTCRLYELFAAYPKDGGTRWRAGSGAIWDLRSNQLRPSGWTSADAAGLPILAGLARYSEVRRGAIDHALRITVPRTRQGFVYPARHMATSRTDPSLPAMGERVRLRRSFDVSRFPRQSRVILGALKRYGALVADHGPAWHVSGAPSSAWDDDDLHSLHRVRGADFEVVDTAGLRQPEG